MSSAELTPAPTLQPSGTRANRRHGVLQAFLLAMIVWLLVMQVAVERSLVPPIGLIQAVFLAIPAGLLVRGWRHAPLLALVFSALTLLGAVPSLIDDLGRPHDSVTFGWTSSRSR